MGGGPDRELRPPVPRRIVKLVIQIPCLNEEEQLPGTLADLPKEIPGVESIDVLIIDDGSTDGTVAAAQKAGVTHFVRFARNVGLARAFRAGLDEALQMGADIVVNTDADNQYVGADIAPLVRPIIDGESDIVVGARDIEANPEFSRLKKRLQRFGTRVVCEAAGVSIPDATSGFRAFSRQAAMRLNVHSEFSYTLETIIQAGRRRIPITSVPIRTNLKTRDSRLFRSIPSYIKRSASTIVRIVAMYEPLKVFAYLGLVPLVLALILGLRFLYFWAVTGAGGHVQSLILAAILAIIGFQLLVIGLVSDLISANRKLLEELLYRSRQRELDGNG